jgi:hypothetical protein
MRGREAKCVQSLGQRTFRKNTTWEELGLDRSIIKIDVKEIGWRV